MANRSDRIQLSAETMTDREKLIKAIEDDPIKAALAGALLALSGHGLAALATFRAATKEGCDHGELTAEAKEG